MESARDSINNKRNKTHSFPSSYLAEKRNHQKDIGLLNLCVHIHLDELPGAFSKRFIQVAQVRDAFFSIIASQKDFSVFIYVICKKKASFITQLQNFFILYDLYYVICFDLIFFTLAISSATQSTLSR